VATDDKVCQHFHTLELKQSIVKAYTLYHIFHTIFRHRRSQGVAVGAGALPGRRKKFGA